MDEFTSAKSWLKKPWMDFFNILLVAGVGMSYAPASRERSWVIKS